MVNTDGKIESSLSQRLFQTWLSAYLKFSKGRLPAGLHALSFVRKAALGDVLMAATVIREFRRKNPKARLTFYTDYVELVRGLPFLDKVGRFEDRPQLHFNLRYEEAKKEPRHWVHIMSETVGITPANVVPDCAPFVEATELWRKKLETARRPVIGIQRKAGSWTPNKDWPETHFEILKQKLEGQATLLELGGGDSLGALVGAIRNCDVIVGPISGPAHVAAAFGIPALVLSSGYELKEMTHYPTTTALRHEVDCAPCWLRTPCPHSMKCMSNVEPEAVLSEMFRILRSHSSKVRPL